jgi:hypothetical protein
MKEHQLETSCTMVEKHCGVVLHQNSGLERDKCVSDLHKKAYNPLWLLITLILAAGMTKVESLAWNLRFLKSLYTVN